MKKEISIVWFRQDLRLADNAALAAAATKGQILPIYIFDDCAPQRFKMGGASKVWLHHSLTALNKSLKGSLNIYSGASHEIIAQLAERYAVKNIFWNVCYEPWHCTQEQRVKNLCDKKSIAYIVFHGNYLFNPAEILKNDGSPYKLFTAYKNKVQGMSSRGLVEVSSNFDLTKDAQNSITIADLGLLPPHNWYKKIEKSWSIGEVAARRQLDFFVSNKLAGYAHNRNYPAQGNVSWLSPHLHFGEISPAQVVTRLHAGSKLSAKKVDVDAFMSELIWREFATYVLYHFPSMHIENLKSKFDRFAWKKNAQLLKAWQVGKTGYPLVDAGMRQLWQTGYMHNRVRMVVASFLVKNLNIHWHEGRDWFWDCLVDADLANNSLNWQWVAGTGIDAAPYFRIFNPTAQGEKFDLEGEYVKKFVPELKNLPDKYLFKPWTASDDVLKKAGVVLGVTYPKPLVDFAVSRKDALARYYVLGRE